MGFEGTTVPGHFGAPDGLCWSCRRVGLRRGIVVPQNATEETSHG